MDGCIDTSIDTHIHERRNERKVTDSVSHVKVRGVSSSAPLTHVSGWLCDVGRPGPRGAECRLPPSQLRRPGSPPDRAEGPWGAQQNPVESPWPGQKAARAASHWLSAHSVEGPGASRRCLGELPKAATTKSALAVGIQATYASPGFLPQTHRCLFGAPWSHASGTVSVP